VPNVLPRRAVIPLQLEDASGNLEGRADPFLPYLSGIPRPALAAWQELFDVA
jgi:hypothetical protein